MKRIFLKFIIAIMAFASLIVPNGVSASGKAFTDVSIYFWAKPNIDHLVELGAIDGLGDGSFGVGRNVTRAQASKIIVESLGWERVTSDRQVFTDVGKNHWAKGYIETLSSKGVIDGYDDGTFKPDAKLTRAQMAKILSKSFDLKKQAKKGFKDVPKSHWAYGHVMKLAESGMTTGYDDQTYRPNNAVTREQMAAFVSRGMAKRDGITLANPPKKPVNKTDKYPRDKTLRDPIRNTPRGAKLVEYDRSFHTYHYKKNLPEGGNISEILVSAGSGENTIFIKGKDKKANKYTGIYLPDELDIKYANRLPELTSDAYGLIYDIGGEFALSYGWQDIYHMIEVNIIYDGKVYYMASNTNSKTLGEELDRHNKYNDTKFTFKKVNGERYIHSFDGVRNNDKYEWIISSDSCKDEVCPRNIDSIKIDKEKDFQIIYVEK